MIKEGYEGRVQAQHKHDLLNNYLGQMFRILGQAKRKKHTINYVDCFAGPWGESSDDLKDTSIALSVAEMRKCVIWLSKKRGIDVEFRGLYIEKDPAAYEKLKAYTDKKSTDEVELHAINADFTESTDEILSWCEDHFTFFFIDPI